MRAFPVAVRGLALVLAAAVLSAPPVQADDPTVAELQAELADARETLDGWYARSAAASERLNGATYDEVQATAALHHSQRAARRAERRLTAQRDAVAALTVQQLQEPMGVARWSAIVRSDGAEQLLERSSAYSSAQEGMTALLDALSAQQVVLDAAVHQAERARDTGRAAEQRRRDAKAEIDTAVLEAEKAVATAIQRRDALIEAMAREQGISLDEADDIQDGVEATPGPVGTPERPGPAHPSPRPSQPGTPTPPPTPVEPPPAPPASSNRVETAIAFAMDQLGERYEWGGAGPSRWDCSGLTMRAWQAAGVSMPHYAGAQYSSSRHVSVRSIKRGDLLYWSDGGPGSIYHVALYLGGGKMIHAPRPGRTVEIVPLTYWIAPDLASRPG